MAAPAQALHEGDDIVAGPDAVAEVEHFDGSLTRLDAGATASLRRIADPTGHPHLILDLGPGASRHRTAPTRSRRGQYEARTAAGSALARAATFVVRNDDDRTWFAALAGTVVVRGRAGGMVVLHAGETVSASRDGALDEVARPGVDALAADEWVAVNAVLDAEAETVETVEAVDEDPPVIPAEEMAVEEEDDDNSHPWRVGVAAAVALGIAAFSVVIGRAGTTQHDTTPQQRDPAVAMPGPPAFATPALTTNTALPDEDTAPPGAPQPDAIAPATAEAPAAAPMADPAEVTSRSCTRAAGGTVVYTGTLANHAAATATYRVTVDFLTAKGATAATTSAIVADVPAHATRTFRAQAPAGGTATSCEVGTVEPA